jgi:threonine dehydrogenase-like Zn-dependent dehydrogenase
MTDKTRSAVAIGRKQFTIEEIVMPQTGREDGLLEVEACGVCGSDLKKYSPESMAPTILGHETVGIVSRLGDLAEQRWGVSEGTRVLLEEYLPCGHCRYCRAGEFRSCRVTDNTQAGALRYGSTPLDVAPGLWGGYSRHQYLHADTVLHVVPPGVSATHATFGIPLSNGIQWAQFDGGVRPGDAVLIMGPGQQGAACLVACREAGAALVVVTGLERDSRRLALAAKLGASATLNAEQEDPVAAMQVATNGAMADLVIDVSGGGAATLMTALKAVRTGGTVVIASGSAVAGSGQEELDLALIRKKRVTIKGVRGHSFAAVERALQLIGAGFAGLEIISGSPIGLDRMEQAMKEAGGHEEQDTLHTIVAPWL